MVAAVSATASFAATYDATNVTTGGNDHTFYFGGAPFGGGNKHWQFEGGEGVFETYDVGVDSFAKLTGTILQNAYSPDPANRFVVDVTFKQAAGSVNGTKCAQGGCDPSSWDFYTFDAATLTGTAGSVTGLVLGLGDRSGAPIGQLGDGANDKNAGFGFSDWFTWSVISNTSNLDFSQVSNFHGDINLNLELSNDEMPAVPLPAGGLLLLSGLVGFGAIRKIRTR